MVPRQSPRIDQSLAAITFDNYAAGIERKPQLERPTIPSPITILKPSLIDDITDYFDITATPFPRPPTPGRGPLSSHPTTPVNPAGQSTPSSTASTKDEQLHKKVDSVTTDDDIALRHTPTKQRKVSPINETTPAYLPSTSSRPFSSHLDTAFNLGTPVKYTIPRKPLAQITPREPEPERPLSRRNSSSVRKLLSLSSLRSSFSSSRTNLSLQRTPSNATNLQDTSRGLTPVRSPPRPSVETRTSSLKPTTFNSNGGTYQTYTTSVTSGDNASYTHKSSSSGIPQLRKRKSNGWFRRSSMLMTLEGDGTGEGDTNLKHASNPRKGDEGLLVRNDSRLMSGDEDPRSVRVPTLPDLELEKARGWGQDMFVGIS